MGRNYWHTRRHESSDDQFRKVEKIKRAKRSVKGRVVDDWFVPENDDEWLNTELNRGMRFGRVIEAHKRHIFIAEERIDGEPATGDLWLCTVAKRHFQRSHKERNFVVVGDKILFQPDDDLVYDGDGQPLNTDLPRGVVQHAFPRKSVISRKDPLNPDWDHIMVANIDMIFIVASVVNPEVRWGLIDRFLVQAELENLTPILILNKYDLLCKQTPEFISAYNERVNLLRSIGYEVLEISALRPGLTSKSVKTLKEKVKGHLVGLCGHSGVGKSSIINLFKPEFEQIVDDNPDIFYKGRHTTSYNSLISLGVGGYGIDTPGIRSFDIRIDDPILLSQCFPEFPKLACQYRQCQHKNEPNCAVRQAVNLGTISKHRYKSYLGILLGVSLREGEDPQAHIIADLKARQQLLDSQNTLNTNDSDTEDSNP